MMTHHFTRSLSSSLEKYSPQKTLPLLSLFQAEQHKVITVRTERGLSGGSVWSAELLPVALLFWSLLEGMFRALATAQKQLFFSHVLYFSARFFSFFLYYLWVCGTASIVGSCRLMYDKLLVTFSFAELLWIKVSTE